MRTCNRCPRQIQPHNDTGTCANCRRLLARQPASHEATSWRRKFGVPLKEAVAALHEPNVARYEAIVAAGGRLFEEAPS